MSDHFVSIIAALHNQSGQLCPAIDSILAQTWTDYELILIDDMSTDDTLQTVQKNYGHLDHLVYIMNEERLGTHQSRNIGVSYARGDYIAFLDVQMSWTPDKLEKQMRQILSDDSGRAVYCSYAAVGGEEAAEFPPASVPMQVRSGNLYPGILDQPLIHPGTLLLAKDVFEAIGGFDTQLPAWQEYEFSIRLAQYGRIDYIPKLLAVSQQKIETNELQRKEEISTYCSLIAAHYDGYLSSGLIDRTLRELYKSVPQYRKEFLFDCLRNIDRKEVQNFVRQTYEIWDTSNRPLAGSDAFPNISEVRDCTGCMSCASSCPTGAISPVYNEEGFLVPTIDATSCTKCRQCVEACPLCNPVKGSPSPENCYAIMASDDVRRKSSSGGVFPVLAESVIHQGGYVAGAVFTEDFMVKHIVANQMDQVRRMYESKYVQSDTSDIYPQIRQLLDDGRLVLFSGCACQVAALHTFLKKRRYANLITVDVVCHGVPSPGVWKNHLAEQGDIASVSFRDKSLFGWNPGLSIVDTDGHQKVDQTTAPPYTFAFLHNWILRDSCYDCHFKKQKYSDITLGDFWGINVFTPFDDGLGTSFATANTPKGMSLLTQLQDRWIKLAECPVVLAQKFNISINQSVKRPAARGVFFQNYQKESLLESVLNIRRKTRFDIGLVVMWAQNYGNALTNYALYTWLEKQGYRVLAIDSLAPAVLRPMGIMGDFAKEHYRLSSDYFIDGDSNSVNESCGCFLVGSDQNWNYHYQQFWKHDDYFYLNFVEEHKKKLSFGTSFGEPAAAIPAELGKPLFQRFDAISTREEFGVNLCRDVYGVDACKVVDPVFLLDSREYEQLASHSSCREEEPYIMTYILNPTPRKRKLCLELQKRLGGIKLVNFLDCNSANEHYNQIMMDYENIRCRAPLEDVVYYMSHCRFMITDSFHGTCFAMLFHKPFVTVRNRERHRFATFEKYAALSGRIIEEESPWKLDQWTQDIDYHSVDSLLRQEIEISKEFLRENLDPPRQNTVSQI